MAHDEFPCWQDSIERTVRKILSHRTKDVHLIDDMCQDVLVKCWQNERTLRDLPSDRFERFVVRVTLNQFFSWQRKQRLFKLPEGYEEGSSDKDPALRAEKTELSLVLLSSLNGLPARYRDIARLHLVEGWTHERIAREKGVPVNTIKTQFRRAKVLLEEVVKGYFRN